MKDLIEVVVFFIIVSIWLAGIVLANGAASKVAAIVFPFYAMYLFIEKLMILSGII